jgi:hypothetical protein
LDCPQGAFKALYVPLEVREQVPAKAVKVKSFGVFGSDGKTGDKLKLAEALESGRIVSRCRFDEFRKTGHESA